MISKRKMEDTTMTKENFAEELRNKLPEYMPDRCKNLRFCIKKINKNNGVELTGILIDDGSKCTPIFYIDRMYDSFCSNHDFKETIRMFAETIINTMDNKPDPDNILKKIKENSNRIIPKLINAEKNQELLKNCPHRIFLDLAVVYEIMLGTNQFILIRNGMSDYRGMTEEELYDLAVENIRNQKQLITFAQMFAGIVDEEVDLEEFPMLIVRTKCKTHGAGIMLCEDVLSEAADMLKSDLYILPSSIHEIIVLPVDFRDDVTGLKDMVNTVNQTQVLPEEFLSDSVYFFDKQFYAYTTRKCKTYARYGIYKY